MRRPLTLVLALALAVVPGARALAAPVAQVQLDVDGDGRPDSLSVTEDGKLDIVATRIPSGQVPLGVDGWRITRATLEHKDYGGGRHVVLVRLAEVDGTQSAALFGLDPKNYFVRLWQGPVGPQGRDGEWAIEVALGDPVPLYFETKDGVARCDGPAAQIARRGFDFDSREWRALGYASALPRPAGAIDLHATRGQAPAGFTATSRPMVFHATSASSSEQDGGSAEDLTTPTEIDDGRLDTAWVEGRVSDGRGEFVTLRSKARTFKVVALRIVPGDAASADAFARSNRLARVHLVTDAGAAYVVSFDSDPTFGEAYWVTLPQPVAARCVSLVVDDVYPAKAAHARPHRTAIAEVAVLTDLDAGGSGALATLAESVASGEATDAQAAEDLLAERGAAGAGALVAAAGKSGRKPAERRRVRLALARMGEAVGAIEVAAGLAEALAVPVVASEGRDGFAGADAAADHTRERDGERLTAGLAKMGAGAEAALATLLGNDAAPLEARSIAARLLGAIPTASARAALDAHCGRGARALRQEVSQALGRRAVDELPAALDEAVAAASATDEPARAREADLWRVVALLAQRATAGKDRVAAAVIARLGAEAAHGYELRHRLIEALAAVSDEGDARAPLLAVLRSEPEPALRLAVVTGLAHGEHLHDAWSAQALIEATNDHDPGVRMAAVAALGARGADDAAGDGALVTRLGDDRWPEVRAAAASGLAPRCLRAAAADALFVAIDRDAADPVRRVALAALVRCRDVRMGAKLLAIVADGRAAPTWRQFAAAQLGALGDRALVPGVLELFERARKDAYGNDDEMWLATALARALGVLADPRTTPVLVEAANDPTLWPVQAAAVEAIGVTCAPAGRRVARAALAAENGQVVGAARRTVRQCGWAN